LSQRRDSSAPAADSAAPVAMACQTMRAQSACRGLTRVRPPRRLLHEVGEPAQRYRSHQSHPARAHSAARLGCARERLCLQRSDPATVWNGDINGMHGCTMHRTRTAALASVPKLLHQHHCEPNIDGCTQRRRAQSHQHTQASSPLVTLAGWDLLKDAGAHYRVRQ
jgi:hypothetical protein